jgi:serine/threonine-protein kinase
MSIDALKAALADRYTIERELGAGGMATVYLAHDIKHDRKVAIKVLKPELAAVLGAERFIQEIKTTAALSHPHILPLFDSGSAEGQLYYVMPYIEGETVRERLNRETQFGIDQSVKITTEVADALDYAHRHGVIHRDIKPENILLHDGRPMVMDFGIALAVSAAAGGRMTETGLSLGTPHYMSPEQATADREITGRSDIYSLGTVLYEMLAGDPPHTGSSAQQIIMKIVTEDVAPITRIRKSVPANVAAALAKALEKLPADRFDTARTFSDALANPAFAATTTTAFTTGPAARRRRWLMWTPATVAVAMTALAAWALTRAPAAPSAEPLRFVLANIDQDAGALAISPDGGTVLYNVRENGAPRGYLRALDSIAARPLRYDGSVIEGTFSPDGKSVAIATDKQQVLVVPLDGGRARTVVSTTTPAGLAWTPAHGLVLGMPAFSNDVWGLSVVPLSGDSAVVVTHPKPNAMHHDPKILGDGNTVLYLDIGMVGPDYHSVLGVGNLAANTWTNTGFRLDRIVGVSGNVLAYIDGPSLKAVRFDPKRHRPVGAAVTVPGAPSSVRTADLATNGTLVMRLWSAQYRVELVDERGVGTTLLPDTVADFYPRFSPDGKRLAITREDAAMPVEVLDLATHTITGLRFGSYGTSLDWSPDGLQVICAGLGRAVTSRPANGTDGRTQYNNPMETSGANLPVASISMAPDGQHLLFGTGFGTVGFDLMSRAVHGDTALTPYVSTPANEVSPRFSPDGRWVAYASDETGRYEVYVQPFPGPGPKLQVSDSGGDQPVWASGNRLYYLNGHAVDMTQLALTGPGGMLGVASRREMFEGDFFEGSGGDGATYDVSPDGTHFVVARAISGGTGKLVAWVNWLAPVQAMLDAEGHR